MITASDYNSGNLKAVNLFEHLFNNTVPNKYKVISSYSTDDLRRVFGSREFYIKEACPIRVWEIVRKDYTFLILVPEEGDTKIEVIFKNNTRDNNFILSFLDWLIEKLKAPVV